MRPSGQQFDTYVPEAVIAVGGRLLEPAVAHRVTRVSVTQRLDPPNQFCLEIFDPELTLISPAGGRITEGAEVQISLGYVGQTYQLITGRIAALTADFPADGFPVLQVDGFDLLHDLARGTAHRVFEGPDPGSGQPDSEIVTTIANEMGLTPAVRQTAERRAARVQNNISDLAFAQELAALNGFALWVQDRTLHFEPERPATGPAIQLARGKTLRSFAPRLSITGQVNAVEVRGWDPAQKQSFTASADGAGDGIALATTAWEAIGRGSGPGQRSVIVIDDASVSSAEEARAVASSTLAGLRQSVVTGTGTCVGQPDMRVGSQLELSGIGRFNGSYTVTEVTHTIDGQGYETSFQVNGAPGTSDLFAAGQGPDRGLVLGMLAGVVTDNKDPQRRGRIRVRIPALNESAEHWARLSTLMAGPERGTFFLPEKGDEVLIAFEQGNVGRPFVLGALWNGRDAQPDPNGNGGNDLRFVKSRSGQLIQLDDTKGAEKLQLIGKDAGNSVTLDAAGPGTVTVHSAGKIRFEAKQIELVADGELTIKGKTVNIN
jgi:phage protein D